jgi:hypothetical protein
MEAKKIFVLTEVESRLVVTKKSKLWGYKEAGKELLKYSKEK